MTTRREALKELLNLTRQHLIQRAPTDRSLLVSKTFSDDYRKVRAAQPQNPQAPKKETAIRKAPVKAERPKPKPANIQPAPKVKPSPAETPDVQSKPSSPLRSQPAESKTAQDFESLRQVLRQALPSLKIIDQLPDDSLAKEKASQWQNRQSLGTICLLLQAESPDEEAFWNQVAGALTLELAPAKFLSPDQVEKTVGWDDFFSSSQVQLVVSSSSTIQHHATLQSISSETSSTSRTCLGKHPLLLLQATEGLINDTLLKRQLWLGLKKEWAGLAGAMT